MIFMVQVHAQTDRQILTIKFAQRVTTEELEEKFDEIKRGLDEMNPGFLLFTDFSELDAMETSATKPVAAYMDLVNEKGVGTVVRVIPDPRKDIGFQLMSLFHY